MNNICRTKMQLEEVSKSLFEVEEMLKERGQDLENLREKENDFLAINKEMSESLVKLQNENCLLISTVKRSHLNLFKAQSITKAGTDLFYKNSSLLFHYNNCILFLLKSLAKWH